ncbi:MAG: septum site-determining protein MinD [Synechococcus sp.]
MTRIIVVTSGKGGVGKTTATANIGAALAKAGKRVALVDADFGLRNLDLLLGLENRVVYTAIDVINGDCRLEQALIKDRRNPDLMLMPASQSRDKTAVTPDQMGELIDRMAPKFDYILIDCPAGIEQGFQNAIVKANEAIVVTTPDISAVRDADRVIGLLEAAQIYVTRLVLNRIRPEMVHSNSMMSVDDVKEILSVPMLGIIPEDEAVIVSTNNGEPMVMAPELAYAGIAFNNVAQRLEGKKVPFLDVRSLNDTFVSRFKRFLSTLSS